eukprot:TRINITY_DN5398_c0_g1_i4.p1 TRINITY_DN5398_c0_g1~~TRINITY_DN5398_c0_g1_i4.p1  ORF type:complete len:391 (+),score=23.90 TRINITY_DN5398_c0_g1_i4:132-1175(+)
MQGSNASQSTVNIIVKYNSQEEDLHSPLVLGPNLQRQEQRQLVDVKLTHCSQEEQEASNKEQVKTDQQQQKYNWQSTEMQQLIGEQLLQIDREENRLINLLEKVMKRKRELQSLQTIQLDALPEISQQKLKARKVDKEDSESSQDSDYLGSNNVKGKGKRAASKNGMPKPKRIRDSRICHICHQQFEAQKMLHCTSQKKGEPACTLTFCGPCVKNRHGETFVQAKASKCWICPRCRGSCGPGCVTCCTCGQCRKKSNLPIISKVLKRGDKKAEGLDNVHDQLIFIETGEHPDKIKARKKQFEWGKFLKVNVLEVVERSEVNSVQMGSEENSDDRKSSEVYQVVVNGI